MNKLSLNKEEQKLLEEDLQNYIQDKDKLYFNTHHRHLSDKKIEKLRTEYLTEHGFLQKDHITQVEKEKSQRDALYNYLHSEGISMTAKEMSQFLKNQGFSVGTSYQTVYKRLLPALIKMGAAKDSAGKWYIPKNEKPKSQDENFSEPETVQVMTNLLETIKGSPVYNNLKSYLLKKSDQNKDLTARRIIFLGTPASNVNFNFFEALYKAMQENITVVIEYKADRKSKTETFGVNPYQLIFDNGYWELWCHCLKPGHEGFRIFNLSRIKNVKLRTDAKRFTLPADFDFRSKTSGTFGCYIDAEDKMLKYTILLKKNTYAQTFSKERILGSNFKMEDTKDGTLIHFESNQYKPVLRWILSWGNSIKPVAPKKLVDDWKKEILAITKELN